MRFGSVQHRERVEENPKSNQGKVINTINNRSDERSRRNLKALSNPTPVSSFSITELGAKPEKICKGDKYRGMTTFNNVLYYTKGSGGNGVNTKGLESENHKFRFFAGLRNDPPPPSQVARDNKLHSVNQPLPARSSPRARGFDNWTEITTRMAYTFGDDYEASHRLRLLAKLYEPETNELLELARSMSGRRIQCALDLGCGPGWSTQLLAANLMPVRAVGIEISPNYVAEARSNHPALEFILHNVLETPFPIEGTDFLFCRFLLTHLGSPHDALGMWAQAVAPGAFLAVHETERICSPHPTLSSYYDMLAQMQRHYGQELNVGAMLETAFMNTDWTVMHSETVVLEKSARSMAQLHAANIRQWSSTDFAVNAFGRDATQQLEHDLGLIVSGAVEAGVVCNTARRIVARRD